jgi:Ca2+-binding RTX toxin-like protein
MFNVRAAFACESPIMCHSRAHLASKSRNRIGNIQSAIGSITVERIGGLVFQGYPGDAIYFGDEIATGAKSAVTIALDDDTHIRLPANARVALTEPVCGPDGSVNVVPLQSAHGASGFNAAPFAGAADVGIDGALRTMRGRARNIGLRMLSLAVLVYSLLHDQQPAQALSTDDDTITPKDSEYGTFEIVTKSGTVVVADDPGLTYRVDNDGAVERRTNSASRMEELQLAQQAVLGTVTHGFAGPAGSSTPLDGQVAPESQPLTIPINFRPLDSVPERITPVFVPLMEDRPILVPPAPPPPPAVAPVITTFTFDSGIDGDRITNNDTLVLIGTASPGTVVSLYDGGALIGTTTADGSGAWRFNTGPLPDGEHIFAAAAGSPGTTTLAARSTFAALAAVPGGNNGPTSPPYIVFIDTKAPAAPVITTLSDGSHEPAGKPTHDTTPTLMITAEAGSTVHIYRNGVLVGTAVESDTPGIFTFTSDALGDGCYTFTATATDIANNTSPYSCEFKIAVDGTPPPAPIFIELADHSCCPDDNLTNDTTPRLVIAAEAGSTVHVYQDGELAGTAVETKKPGIFTFTSDMLADGNYTFTATATDEADNLSLPSAGFTIAVVTSDPNDFDNLAMGHRIAIAPDGTVHGTPKDDVIRFKSDYCDPGRTVYAGAGNDYVKGTDQDDVIYGGSGKDKIIGNNGADVIFGGFGDDRIDGGKGNDIIIGGYGADIMTGGKGHDTFVFLSEIDSPPCQRDTISDFDSGRDRIDLSAIDADASQIDNQAFIFAGQTNSYSVSENSVTWYYDRHTDRTYILADTDGATDAAEIEIVLAGKVNLTQNNFLL